MMIAVLRVMLGVMLTAVLYAMLGAMLIAALNAMLGAMLLAVLRVRASHLFNCKENIVLKSMAILEHCSPSPNVLFAVQAFDQNTVITVPNTCSHSTNTNTCSQCMKRLNLQLRTIPRTNEHELSNMCQHAI